MQLNDELRAAILSVARALFPVALILGVTLEEAEIGMILIFIDVTLTLIALVMKQGQQQGPGGDTLAAARKK